jgi:outer membrane protein assembly factor BamB
MDSTPAVAEDGTVYAGSRDMMFTALLSDGNLKWRLWMQSPVVSSPAIGPDGSVYFFGMIKNLVSLSGGSPPATSSWPMFRGNARRTGRVNEVRR